MEEKQKDVIIRVRDENYRDIFVWGVYGGSRSDHFEMVIQSQGVNAAQSQSQNKIVTEIRDEVCLKMTPEMTKIIYNWLRGHIDSFEKTYRKIKEKGNELKK